MNKEITYVKQKIMREAERIRETGKRQQRPTDLEIRNTGQNSLGNLAEYKKEQK
jgi:hypothetical protein